VYVISVNGAVLRQQHPYVMYVSGAVLRQQHPYVMCVDGAAYTLVQGCLHCSRGSFVNGVLRTSGHLNVSGLLSVCTPCFGPHNRLGLHTLCVVLAI
jgi:hypothetical protein